MNLHHISFLVAFIGVVLLTCVPLEKDSGLNKIVRVVTTVAAAVWFIIEVFGAVPTK